MAGRRGEVRLPQNAKTRQRQLSSSTFPVPLSIWPVAFVVVMTGRHEAFRATKPDKEAKEPKAKRQKGGQAVIPFVGYQLYQVERSLSEGERRHLDFHSAQWAAGMGEVRIAWTRRAKALFRVVRRTPRAVPAAVAKG